MKLLDIFDSPNLSKVLENLDGDMQSEGTINIDNVNGIGSVPHNQDIDYFGLRVFMKPKTFLALAHRLDRPDADSTDGIKQAMLAGKGIGAPFLKVEIPKEWTNGDYSVPAKVNGHEGRNRMWAAFEIDGNDPVEVHIMPIDYRARNLKPEWVDRLKQGMVAEGTNLEVKGPLFVVANVSEELDEVYPGQSSGKLKNWIRNHYDASINCTNAAKVKNDPDASHFIKKRASWYQSLHCKGRKQIRENTGSALTIFDIDDTLFRTSANVLLHEASGNIRELSASEFNSYMLKDGEKFDFSQFQDAKLFNETSVPIENLWRTAQNTLNNVGKRPGSRVVIVTARSDFDDRDQFLETFIKHGLDINKIHVHRAGNLTEGNAASKKKIIIRKLLQEGSYSEVRLFDDHQKNLEEFLSLSKEFPEMVFKAFPVSQTGRIGNPITVCECQCC